MREGSACTSPGAAPAPTAVCRQRRQSCRSKGAPCRVRWNTASPSRPPAPTPGPFCRRPGSAGRSLERERRVWLLAARLPLRPVACTPHIHPACSVITSIRSPHEFLWAHNLVTSVSQRFKQLATASRLFDDHVSAAQAAIYRRIQLDAHISAHPAHQQLAIQAGGYVCRHGWVGHCGLLLQLCMHVDGTSLPCSVSADLSAAVSPWVVVAAGLVGIHVAPELSPAAAAEIGRAHV